MPTDQHAATPAEVTDPVCGMTIDPADAAGHIYRDGQTYYFCNENCLAQFSARPSDFVGTRSGPAPAPTAPGTDTRGYTCPMHPQIRQVGPGSCPICGMALEPVTATLEEHPNEELVDMSRRFWVGAALTLPAVDSRDGRVLSADR